MKRNIFKSVELHFLTLLSKISEVPETPGCTGNAGVGQGGQASRAPGPLGLSFPRAALLVTLQECIRFFFSGKH